MPTPHELLVRYYTDVWTAWDMEPVAGLVTDDVEIKTPFTGDLQIGPDQLYAQMGAMKAGFPDLAASLADVSVDGDTISATVRWTGTQTGHVWRHEAAGASLEVTAPVLAAVADGRLSRVVEDVDWTVPRSQVGAPPPEVIELPDQRVIPCFRTMDWEASRRFYCGVLGFRVLFEWRHGCDFPVYAGIERDGAQLHVSEHAGDAQVGGSVNITWDDVDALYAEAVAHGLDGVEPPIDQPWGERGFNLHDPDGNNLSFTRPIG